MGGKLALHRTTAADSYVPYLRPQECGAHEDVRFAAVTDETGYGIRAEAAGAPFSLSVLPWSAMELTAARHPDELASPTYTWLDIACCRRGVGGDDSWGSPVHDEYCLPSDREYAFSFILSVVDAQK
jgi:beta-galactosidase